MVSSTVRAYFFLAETFQNRQNDPFCRMCKAFVNSVNTARENLARFESGQVDELKLLSPDLQQLLAKAKNALSAITLPENAPGQKKAGNCKLPQGVCFVKSSLAILQNLETNA